MARFKQLYRIIEDVVNAISWSINITSNTDNGDGTYTLEVGCTAYLNKCEVFKDSNDDEWEVDSFVFNKSLTVKPKGHSNAFTDTTLELSTPKYLHGTVRLTQAEYDRELKKQGIHPLIYLYETLQEQVTLVKKDAVERTANIRVFIITANNFEDFIRADYDSEIFDPLSNIEEKFINELVKNPNIGRFTERHTRINHEQFAYTDRNGYLKRIFDGELSALELQIPVNINRCNDKNFNC